LLPFAVMDAAVSRDPLASHELVGQWRELWERDPGASVFQRPEYLRAWLPEFGGDRRPLAVEVRDGEALRGLANLSVDADGVLRFLGDKEVTDYFGPIAAPEDRDAVADAVIAHAARTEGWTRAELLGLDSTTGWVEALERAAKSAGLSVEQRQHDVCPRVAIPGSYDDYLASIDSKLRHEIKRKARKLEREAGPFTIRMGSAATLHDDMETFFELHRTSSGPKGHFLHWGMAGFFILLARAFEERGWLRLTMLDCGGRTLAAVLSFAARGTWSVYNSGYDHTMRDLAPGMVLMGETIRLACEEGAHTFDLLRGDEPYKYRFGAVDTPLIALDVTR
jgi:CelD/BcsL family acetyltransferase involved in cellulose biosynthesis